MHVLQTPKRKTPVAVRILDVATGHKSHLSGGGCHQDRRSKRLRTRKARQRAVLADY